MYIRDLLEVCKVSLDEEILVNYLISIKRLELDDSVKKLKEELHQFLLKKKGKRILNHFIMNFTDATMNWFADKPRLKTAYAKQTFGKNQDFDSYRNTYLGFIFQEFYIIEDFSVEETSVADLEWW